MNSILKVNTSKEYNDTLIMLGETPINIILDKPCYFFVKDGVLEGVKSEHNIFN